MAELHLDASFRLFASGRQAVGGLLGAEGLPFTDLPQCLGIDAGQRARVHALRHSTREGSPKRALWVSSLTVLRQLQTPWYRHTTHSG